MRIAVFEHAVALRCGTRIGDAVPAHTRPFCERLADTLLQRAERDTNAFEYSNNDALWLFKQRAQQVLTRYLGMASVARRCCRSLYCLFGLVGETTWIYCHFAS